MMLPLLLIPGTLCDGRLWAPVKPWLLAQVTCVEMAWGLETTQREAAKRILRQAPERFMVLGMSMGGSVALDICALAPERVAGLVLVSAQPYGETEDRTLARAQGLAYARCFGLDAWIQNHLWPQYVHPSRIGDAQLLDVVVAMAQAAGMESYTAQHRLLASRVNHIETLASLYVPTLICAGDADQLCVPPLQAEMAACAKNCTLVMLSQCGHMSPLEAPRFLASAINGWINETGS